MSDSVRPQRQQPTRLPRPWDSPGKNTGVCCNFLLQCMKVKSESEVAQSCPTLSDPMDCSLPGSSVHGIFQARVLEWVAIDVTQDQAFAHANDVLKNAVGGISDIIHMHGLVNVDFEDVKTVMGEPGKAMMGTAIAGGPDRATKAADAAVACPLLEGIDLSGAHGVLVLRSEEH